MRSLPIALVAVALLGCGSEPPEQRPVDKTEVTPEPSGPPLAQQAQPRQELPAAEVESVGGGLRIDNPDGTLRMSLLCSGAPAKLVATVPSFTPIGSEDRFALALGQEPVTLVADPARQKAGAGVRAEGPVPENFAALLADADQIGALYGTQKIGPHPLTKGAAARLAKECGS